MWEAASLLRSTACAAHGGPHTIATHTRENPNTLSNDFECSRPPLERHNCNKSAGITAGWQPGVCVRPKAQRRCPTGRVSSVQVTRSLGSTTPHGPEGVHAACRLPWHNNLAQSVSHAMLCQGPKRGPKQHARLTRHLLGVQSYECCNCAFVPG